MTDISLNNLWNSTSAASLRSAWATSTGNFLKESLSTIWSYRLELGTCFVVAGGAALARRHFRKLPAVVANEVQRTVKQQEEQPGLFSEAIDHLRQTQTDAAMPTLEAAARETTVRQWLEEKCSI